MTDNLLDHLDGTLKPLADRMASATKRAALLSGRLSKSVQLGDVRQITNAIEELATTPAKLIEAQKELAEAQASFDSGNYLREAFPVEFEQACAAEGLKLEGYFPRYHIFPFDVVIDPDGLSALVNRKRTGALRPAVLAREARREKERLESSKFSPDDFLCGLFHAWENLNLRYSRGRKMDLRSAVKLRQVYRELNPMRRQRREYPETFFAFDVQRLISSGVMEIHGHQCQLGSARDASGALRMLDRQGQERFLSTVNFVKVG